MNTIKIRLNKRLGDFPKGKILDAELKTHGVVTLDNNGASRILEAGEFTVYDAPKGVRIGLRKARELTGLKVMDVGNAIERSRTSMNGYENGDREVQEETKEAYAKALGMKIEWLEWNVDVNKAYYNDMIMKKIKSSMQQVDETKKGDKVESKTDLEAKVNWSVNKISSLMSRLNKFDIDMNYHREKQKHTYVILGNEIEALNKAIKEYNNLPWYKRLFSKIDAGNVKNNE